MEKRASLHDENDFEIEKCRDKLTDALSINTEETIKVLKRCNKDELLLISEVFEEIAYNLQSQSYIDCLDELDIKYPDLYLTDLINVAKSYLNWKEKD
ncbi:hypothetical protein [Hazenella coriacea]|uniref:hypothetical protein n=1 Tax=Hazenella coriacea TaxID=1179467 RepID=UPI001FB4B5AA|nr:hypothetical protein [Hazenella coriacea]